MEDMFDEINSETMIITAEEGMNSIETLMTYHTAMLEVAIAKLMELTDLNLEDVVNMLEEKSDMVGVLDNALNRLNAVIDVTKSMLGD